MSIIRLVRHGEAAAGFGDDLDPGLSAAGVQQAAAVAERLAGVTAPLLLTSPMRRARETAAPLAARREHDALVEAAVGEVPTPSDDLRSRSEWLGGFLAGSWGGQDDSTLAWRDQLVGFLTGVEADAVVFSHFVAINAAVAAATGDERTVVFRPGYCSVTTLDNSGDRLSVVELGGDARTDVR